MSFRCASKFRCLIRDFGVWSIVPSTFPPKASLQRASSSQQKKSSGPLLLSSVATVMVLSPDSKANSSLSRLSFPGIANRESQIENRKSENRVNTAMPPLSQAVQALLARSQKTRHISVPSKGLGCTNPKRSFSTWNQPISGCPRRLLSRGLCRTFGILLCGVIWLC